MDFKQEEVPGYPGFFMFAASNESDGENAEREYRDGYFQAVSILLGAIIKSDAYSRGYQRAIVEIGRLVEARGRLDARDLEPWVSGRGSQWLEEVRLDLQVLPPALPQD